MEDKVAQLCFSKYSELGKSGKPRDGEWTLLAGFVVENSTGVLELVSLASGTKCVGKSKMSSSGALLNDSHAEVLSRRSLLRYLYANIKIAINGGNSPIFECVNGSSCRLKSGIRFHFFCSHVPCGDASIIPMLKRKSDQIKVDLEKRLKSSDSTKSVNSEDSEGDFDYEDVYRTGGKCISAEDPLGEGIGYHTVGAVRNKPGRGEPTLSLSCSDKIAKWIYCGVQGAMLSILIVSPIFIESITVGGGGQFCLKAMQRALIDRGKPKHVPVIRQSTLIFQHSRYFTGSGSSPCATSIIWCLLGDKPLEISVEGRRLGITKKCKESAIRLKVSKMELFITFIRLTGDRFAGKTYAEVKSEANLYNYNFISFKKNMGSWTTKPELQSFLPDI